MNSSGNKIINVFNIISVLDAMQCNANGSEKESGLTQIEENIEPKTYTSEWTAI